VLGRSPRPDSQVSSSHEQHLTIAPAALAPLLLEFFGD
jgi:hypothetical protein